MIREGAMEGVSDGVFGYHNTNLLPLGSVWVQPSVASAHCCDLRVTVTGKGGHASMPHLCRDPLLAAAHMVVGLNNIVSRRFVCVTNGCLRIPGHDIVHFRCCFVSC